MRSRWAAVAYGNNDFHPKSHLKVKLTHLHCWLLNHVNLFTPSIVFKAPNQTSHVVKQRTRHNTKFGTGIWEIRAVKLSTLDLTLNHLGNHTLVLSNSDFLLATKT